MSKSAVVLLPFTGQAPVAPGLVEASRKRKAEDASAQPEVKSDEVVDPTTKPFDLSALDAATSQPKKVTKTTKSPSKGGKGGAAAKTPTEASLRREACDDYLDNVDAYKWFLSQTLADWFGGTIKYDDKLRRRLDAAFLSAIPESMLLEAIKDPKSPHYSWLLWLVRAHVLVAKICPEVVDDLVNAGLDRAEGDRLLSFKAKQSAKKAAEMKNVPTLKSIIKTGVAGRWPMAYQKAAPKGGAGTGASGTGEELTRVQKLEKLLADPDLSTDLRAAYAERLTKARGAVSAPSPPAASVSSSPPS